MMRSIDVVTALAALAQETRLAIYRLLVEAGPDGLAAGAIADKVGVAASSLSFHLAQLLHAGLVSQRRVGRSLIYAADYTAMNGLMGYLTENCCGGQACAPVCQPARVITSEKAIRMTYSVLFLCAGNSARSILGEALLNYWGKGKFTAFSAGSFPKGTVNPMALELLRSRGLPTEGLRSKSWSEFAKPDAPAMDFVITVCDQAANEVCPVWPGHPITAHWGIPDPAAVEGTDSEKIAAFRDAYLRMDARIKLFVALPLDKLDGLKREQEARRIGRDAGKPSP